MILPFPRLLVGLSFLLALSCTTSPTGRKQLALMPEDQMSAMGVQAFDDIKNNQKIAQDPKQVQYVKCVADAITTTLSEKNAWEVVVFQDDNANAFALPGYKIGVHTGLLKVAQNADQLATVIGHEVAHVLAHHGNERVSEQFATQASLSVLSGVLASRGEKYPLLMGALGVGTQYGILLPHSRGQESEADVMGLDLMARADFNPQESVQLWKNMAEAGGGQPPEFLSTHPSHGTRIGNLTNEMTTATQKYVAARASGRRPQCSL